MTATATPRFDILPAPQRRLWDELDQIPATMVLYGGTALALRLGHRQSVDFDFFTDAAVDAGRLRATVPFLRDAQTLDQTPNGLTVSVDRGGPVKVSFFGGIDFGRVGTPERATASTVLLASLLDLGATQIKVLLQRVEAKDYQDIAALLAAGTSLADILGAARALFGPAFNLLVARKALTYFEGGDLDRLTEVVRDRLTSAALADFEVTSLERLSSTLRPDA